MYNNIDVFKSKWTGEQNGEMEASENRHAEYQNGMQCFFNAFAVICITERRSFFRLYRCGDLFTADE